MTYVVTKSYSKRQLFEMGIVVMYVFEDKTLLKKKSFPHFRAYDDTRFMRSIAHET